MNKNSIIVIPARFASTRFPGKPLKMISGKMMIQRVWELACLALSPQQVFIATDSQEIEHAAKSFSAQVIMTSPDCRNGSERVWDALQQLDFQPDVIVNFQGDAVLTPPWIIQDLLTALAEQPEYGCATPKVRIENTAYEEFQLMRLAGSSSGTFVVSDAKHRALYFSNAIIPYFRKNHDQKYADRHLGIYAYRFDTLKKYLALTESSLEQIEQLEQLRMLENGIEILTVPVDLKGRTMASIDSPEDLIIAEKLIAIEGELV